MFKSQVFGGYFFVLCEISPFAGKKSPFKTSQNIYFKRRKPNYEDIYGKRFNG